MGIVVFMPLITKIPLAIAMHKIKGYDNEYPRLQQSKLEGAGARALAAHKNCFEAICYFAPTVLLVITLDEHTLYTVQLSIAFVIARILYLCCYWCNWNKLRSTSWLIGMCTIVAHYWMLLD